VEGTGCGRHRRSTSRLTSPHRFLSHRPVLCRRRFRKLWSWLECTQLPVRTDGDRWAMAGALNHEESRVHSRHADRDRHLLSDKLDVRSRGASPDGLRGLWHVLRRSFHRLEVALVARVRQRTMAQCVPRWAFLCSGGLLGQWHDLQRGRGPHRVRRSIERTLSIEGRFVIRNAQ
jgi:hypothetical protein